MKQSFNWEDECCKDIHEFPDLLRYAKAHYNFSLPNLRRPARLLIPYSFQVYFIDIFILTYTPIIQLL